MAGTIGIGGGAARESTSRDTFVDPRQQPFLDFVRNAGVGLFQTQLPGLSSQFGTAQQFQGIGQGLVNQATQAPSIGRFANQSFAPQQIQGIQNVLNRNLQENLLPSIGGSFVSSAGTAGSRRGIAEGLALRGTQETLGNLAGQIQAQDLARQQSAAQSADAARLSGAQTGLGALQGLQNIGLAPFAAQLAPLLALASVIGQPTVLDRTRGRRSQFQFDLSANPGTGFFPS